MTPTETMRIIIREYKRGRMTYTEATRAIYKAVTRHKYTAQWMDAATEALKAIG